MKEKIKKVFEILFGTKVNILFKIQMATLLSAILFTYLCVLSPSPSFQNIYINVAGFFYFFWIASLQENGFNLKFIFEVCRLSICFIVFVFSGYTCLSFCLNYEPISVIKVIFSTMGLFLCLIYLVCKISDIYHFVVKAFKQIKGMLFNSTASESSKSKSLVENITAFLVTIGAFFAAVKAIIESLSQIIKYL